MPKFPERLAHETIRNSLILPAEGLHAWFSVPVIRVFFVELWHEPLDIQRVFAEMQNPLDFFPVTAWLHRDAEPSLPALA